MLKQLRKYMQVFGCFFFFLHIDSLPTLTLHYNFKPLLYIVAPQFMWCCTFRVIFFTRLALPSGAAVQSLWGATSGGWHLWLWRQYQRGVVRPMDAAWSLLPVYEEPQRQAKHCQKKTLWNHFFQGVIFCAHCLPVSVSCSLRSPTYSDRRPRQRWGVYWTCVTHFCHSSTHSSITHTPQLTLWPDLYSWSMSPFFFIPCCFT